MNLIDNLLLIPFKLIILALIILVIILNLVISIFTGLSSLILNLFTGLFGIIFIYQLFTRNQTFYSILGALLFLFFGAINLILMFFPTTTSFLTKQMGKGLAFWF